MIKPLRKMSAEEFARRVKMITLGTDKRFAIFLGAGCSVSSGIPAAGALVKDHWLPNLRAICEPDCKDLDKWAERKFKDYDPKNPATLYGAVMEELFINPDARQNEIENLCDGKFPGFGYAVLASLVAMEDGHFNVVLTTNFDDLMADALYLFSQTRPLVIHHESLASYIRPTRTRPLIVKLHGDNRLSPQNTAEETQTLKDNIENKVRSVLHDRGLIFMGYGGNDVGVKKMLEAVPREGFPLGVFWVSGTEPEGIIRPWLESRKATWIERSDFDEMMLLMRNTFDLPHPNRARFDDVFGKYKDTYDIISARIDKLPSTAPDASALKNAIERADKSFRDHWAVVKRAQLLENTNPDQANAIYLKGLKQFPNSAPLYGSYAIFLCDFRKNYDEAEKYFKLALEANPNSAQVISNYAKFLYEFRQNYDGAEKYFKRVLTIEPKEAIYLCNYATFLSNGRMDYDKAEEYYRRALEADPNYALLLGNYAVFLSVIRKNYDGAEEYYKRALEADPDNTDNLGYYANFLKNVRKDYEGAENYYKRTLAANPKNANDLGNYAGFILAMGRGKEGLPMLERLLTVINASEMPSLATECWFYAFAHRPIKGRDEALRNLKKALVAGSRSPNWDLASNIAQAKKEGHPDALWLEKLAAVISEGADIKTLEAWPKWQNA